MKVQPITDARHVRSIKRLLTDRPRDKLMFVMGINSGLRVQDLLALRIKDVQDVKVGDRITLKEKKTDKVNVLMINKEIFAALHDHFQHLADDENTPDHFLFKSRKTKNSPLTTYAVMGMIKRWTEEIGLKGNFGAHSLRKTWCYFQRKEFGVGWELIAKRLNHSNPAVTRRYLGVADEEVEEILLNEV
jgi:integrase